MSKIGAHTALSLILAVVIGLGGAMAFAGNNIPLGPSATGTSLGTDLEGEAINWQVVAVGGNRGTSDGLILTGTIGQTAVISGGTTGLRLGEGFWQHYGASFICGDVNGSGFVNITDVVFLTNYVFVDGLAPQPYQSGDADCNGIVNIADAVYVLAYIFSEGPLPCASCV